MAWNISPTTSVSANFVCWDNLIKSKREGWNSLWNSFKWKFTTPNCWSITNLKIFPSQTAFSSMHIAQLPLTPMASHKHKHFLPTFPQAIHQSRNLIYSNLSNLLIGILSNTLHLTLLPLFLEQRSRGIEHINRKTKE